MAFGLFAGCGDKPKGPGGNGGTPEGVYEPTEREQTEAVVFGIDGADGVFSPFFSTAAYDSEITGMTQLGMLTSEGSNYVYGDNEACIVKDLDISYLDGNMTEISSATGAQYTRYDFLIKNGIKFSDGEDLTIDDVLFNLYVYLDPAYTGSSTIYSTDIVGLNAYRTQSQDEGVSESLEKTANANANARLTRVYNYLVNSYLDETNNGESDSTHTYQPLSADQIKEAKEDVKFFLPLYEQEIETNYESAVSSFDEDRKSYMFEAGEYWQSYLYTYGIIVASTDPSGKPVKQFVRINKDTGAYETVTGVTEPDPDNGIYEVYVFDFEDLNKDTKDSILASAEEYADENWQSFDGANEAEKRAAALEEGKKQAAIAMVYEYNVGYEDEYTGEFRTSWLNLANAVVGSGSTGTLFTELLADERSKLIDASAGEEAIRSISGITTSRETEFTNSEGTYKLDAEYDVLHILINKVDPKAIWNFAFTVAPQHYYAPASALETYERAGEDINFGVVFNSTDFMNNVLKETERLGVPVGAGPYMASQEGGLPSGQKYPAANRFMRDNRVYYERNPYFDTVDGVVGGEIQNAKIKYLQYTIVNANFLLDSLAMGEIDVGTPNATADNIDRLNTLKNLSFKNIRTNGYGYVGINAGKVRDVWMRRAIIKAMNTDLVMDYYANGTCELIYRPMSKESWAYPKGEAAQMEYTGTASYTGASGQYSAGTTKGEALDYKYDESGADILTMLHSHGYEVNGGRVLSGPNGQKLEKITFTVAGESQDHPAWTMFKRAETVLESIGFEIDVKTDAFALNKLSKGELSVWAAAWSSTIDPDMYQVYHKDSQAGSTLNWGYREIKAEPANYSYENQLINELSDLIDQARSVIAEATRADIYAKALDLVMELAVEMPTYQRNDLNVYNNTKIDGDTLNPNPTSNDGLFSKVWEIGYVN